MADGENVARIWATGKKGDPRTYGVWNKRRKVWMVRGGLTKGAAEAKGKELDT